MSYEPVDQQSLTEIIHPRDRYGQSIAGRYTSHGFSEALGSYLSSTAVARSVAKKILRDTCTTLSQDILTIIQASHVAMLLQVAVLHATASTQKGWALPSMQEHDGDCRASFEVSGMSPYWMDNNALGAVRNSFALDGVFLLTAPNMSGECTHISSNRRVG